MKMKVRNLMVGFSVGLCFIISACDNGGETPDELQRWYEEVAIIDSNLACGRNYSGEGSRKWDQHDHI